MKLQADVVAKAFNDNCPSHWRARAYLKNRQSGTFNACKFTYKGGMVQFLMDCDAPIGSGFQIKFTGYIAAFGDYTAAIQKGLYQILSRLRDAELAPMVPEDIAPFHIMFGLRRDGAVTYLVIYTYTGEPSPVVIAGHSETAAIGSDDEESGVDDLL